MAKRVYLQTVIKWVIGIGVPVGTAIGAIFMFLIQTGAITVTGYSGDMACRGTLADPCYAYVNFTANEDIFIYPLDYDPYGRNTPFSFDPALTDWSMARSWGAGWREIPLDKSCTGTWCGLSNSKDTRLFSIAFRQGKSYQIRVTGYKSNPNDVIKWGFFANSTRGVDPVWLGVKSIVKKEYTIDSEKIFYDDNTVNHVLYGIPIFSDAIGSKLKDLISIKNCEFCDTFKIDKDLDSDYPLDVIDYNMTSIIVCLNATAKKYKDLIPLEIYDKNNESIKYKEDKIKFNSKIDIQCYTYDFDIDKVLKFGPNSTKVSLSAQSGYFLQDVTIKNGTQQFCIQTLINISSIPAIQNILDSTYCMIINSGGLEDTDSKISRVLDQTWTEASNAATFASQSKDNVDTTHLFSNNGASGSNCINITAQVKADYDDSNTKASFRIEDLDRPCNTVTIVEDGVSNILGYNFGGQTVGSREASTTYSPYLNITYESGGNVNPTLTNIVPANNSAHDIKSPFVINATYTDANSDIGTVWFINNTNKAILCTNASISSGTTVHCGLILNYSDNVHFYVNASDGNDGIATTGVYNFSINSAPEDSCTYSGSGDFLADASDNCIITENTAVDGLFSCLDDDGAGTFTITATFNITKLNLSIDCKLNVSGENGKIQYH